MKQISKYIFWCIIIGLSFNMVKLYFAQNNMATAQEGIFPWYFRLDFLGDVLISFAAVASFFTYKEYFPSYVRVCYVLLVLFVTIASFETLSKTLGQPTFFYSIKGIGTYLNIGILFFAADTKYFPKVLNFFYFACFGILAASIINIGKAGMGASRKEFLLALRDFAVFLMWVFPFFFLQDEPNKKKNLINMAAFLLIFIIVLSSGSRSYLVLYLLYIMIKFRAQLQTKNGILVILGMLVLVGVGYFVLMNSELSGTVEGAFTNLSERSGEDTRSDQLLDFFSQYDMEYMIQGVGPLQLWYWHSINDYYGFLDNQFVLIAWWAGLPTILTYIVLLVKSLFTKVEILQFEDIKGTKIIIFFWIAACLGLAIYCTVCSEHYYYFLSLLMGLNACQYSKIIEQETEHDEEYEDT
ncbi:MAG: hypothetical protein IPP72_15050 [Chitinophagaceae bacterium]|nr:hypothetical protein [Chitinophagaceae bacterium]